MTTHLRIREAHAQRSRPARRLAIAMAWETEHKKLDPDTVRRGVAAGIADPAKARYFIAMDEAERRRPRNHRRACRYADAHAEWSDWRDGEWWWIQSVYVPSAHRRKGVFAALYRHVEKLARDSAGIIGCDCTSSARMTTPARRTHRWGMVDAGYAIFEANRTNKP
jgi:GNAT superfamily N-acetyltransferase